MEDSKMTVRAVERALDILLCFAGSPNDLSLTELSTRVGLHKSTVFRLLASLEGKGFVIRDPETEKYRIGLRIWELAAGFMQSDDPAIMLLPEMERLRDLLGETISLYLRDGRERVRIQAVQSNQAIRRVAPIGARLPLNVGASSKVLIAFSEPQVREALLRELDWVGEQDRQAFEQKLEEIRLKGYATSVEERETGAAAVAAPIWSSSGKLAVALGVSGPSNRLTAVEMERIAPMIMEAAERMGRMIK
jgi:IclR family transcriptional regulator, KDG regulon repressor